MLSFGVIVGQFFNSINSQESKRRLLLPTLLIRWSWFVLLLCTVFLDLFAFIQIFVSIRSWNTLFILAQCSKNLITNVLVRWVFFYLLTDLLNTCYWNVTMTLYGSLCDSNLLTLTLPVSMKQFWNFEFWEVFAFFISFSPINELLQWQCIEALKNQYKISASHLSIPWLFILCISKKVVRIFWATDLVFCSFLILYVRPNDSQSNSCCF